VNVSLDIGKPRTSMRHDIVHLCVRRGGGVSVRGEGE